MLSDTKARQTKPRGKPYKLADQRGLYLYVSPNGGKSWRYDYRLHGRRETLTLGLYPEVTLHDARERHMGARKRVAQGESPAKQKRIEKQAAMAQMSAVQYTRRSHRSVISCGAVFSLSSISLGRYLERIHSQFRTRIQNRTHDSNYLTQGTLPELLV